MKKMANCTQNAHDFIVGSFPVLVGALASEDAESLCRKNNLSFIELIRPFCQLYTDAQIRDPVNPNIIVNIKKWKIRVVDIQSSLPPTVLVNHILHDVVNKLATKVDMKSRFSVEKQMKATAPWYEAYRDCYLQLLHPVRHEFIRDFLACIFVVSTKHPDPMQAFAALVSRQNSIQNSNENSKKTYNWFSDNTFKYYLLLHDNIDGSDKKAESVYESMKIAYGSSTCFLLKINSGPSASMDKLVKDPWTPHMYPFWEENLVIDDNELERNSSVGQTNQYEADLKEEVIVTELELIDKEIEHNHVQPPPMSFNDPLTSMHYKDTLDITDTDSLGPLTNDLYYKKEEKSVQSTERSLKMQDAKTSLRQFSFSILTNSDSTLANIEKHQNYGLFISSEDQDRIKEFVFEFCVRGLLPHIEKLMRTISEQIISRKGIHKSIFNATKKWFGGNKTTNVVTSSNNGVSYAADSPELHHRRLGDLAFLIQHYELAYSSYHSAKREFNNDHAWVYFAGALEMASVSAFMLGAARVYPVHYFEASISTYLNTCRMPELATRACLLSTTALQAKEMYPEATVEFIKLTNEDSDLRSGLLLEQAAHCFLHNNPPLVRKYAFHMILAGHRFSKSVQRRHALRCYLNALAVYQNKNWHLAEDHINFIIGRQSFNMNCLSDAQEAYKSLLMYESQQSMSQQASHLREFLIVFKKNLEVSNFEFTNSNKTTLPILPLPRANPNSIRCLLLINEQMFYDGGSVPSKASVRVVRNIKAGSYSFQTNYSKILNRWASLEKTIVTQVTGETPFPFKPFVPCLSAITDNKYSPIVAAGECFAYEIVFSNPLKIPLTMINLVLLWEFHPDNDQHNVITNKHLDHSDCIYAEVIESINLPATENKVVSLRLTSKMSGCLEVVGIKYILSSIAVIISLEDTRNIEVNTQHLTTLISCGVAGMQPLKVAGPRLNSTKQERANKVYGLDKRLNVTVVSSLPLIEVNFLNVPTTLLCGEIYETALLIKNIGMLSAKNIYIACSHNSFFTLGCDANIQCNKRNNIFKIPVDKLVPGEHINFPITLYGIEGAGVHEIDFIFYYEPFEYIKLVPYRVLQHTLHIQTLSTLSLSAQWLPSLVNNQLYKEFNKDINSARQMERLHENKVIVTLTVENRSQGSMSLRCSEFTLNKLHCSSQWHLSGLLQSTQDTLTLRPSEKFTLHLKITASNLIAGSDNLSIDECVGLSSILLSQDQSLKKKSISEFFNIDDVLSSMNKFLLLLEWETFYIDETFTRNVIKGQSHVVLGENERTCLPTNFDLPEGVCVSYEHPVVVKHDFNKQKLCILPVKIKSFNNTDQDVEIRFETEVGKGRTDVLLDRPSSLIRWVGQLCSAITIPSKSNRDLVMYCAMTSFGVYEIQNISAYIVNGLNIKNGNIPISLPSHNFVSVVS
ncbi:trafficking protein particle complex subunit 8 isoform X2 [Hydra vulgaris]|uniref:trafficking protein particle complex subunit 8 isoform X2 n=1 Tax=Hydra vulgaris TaxID=6087 RepID=UPI001F5FCD7D|nr:trafficking protein particle complex subunit 8 isoform X2 [Hydra vulgaris]